MASVTRLLVASIGHSDLEIVSGAPIPDCPLFRDNDGHDSRDLQDWAHTLDALQDERLVQGLRLPRLSAVIRELGNASRPLRVVLVGTDGNHPNWAPTDSIGITEVIGRVLRATDRLRPWISEVQVEAAWGEPIDLDQMWAESERICNSVSSMGADEVNLLLGATPSLRESLRLRFLLAHELGTFTRVRLWQVRDGRAEHTDPPRLLNEFALIPRLRKLAEELRFGEVLLLVERWPVLVPAARERIISLARFGQALLDLRIDDALGLGVDGSLAEGLQSCRFPQNLQEYLIQSGPLADLTPLYSLMLGVLKARVTRSETVWALSAIYLMSEFMVHLVSQDPKGFGNPLDPVVVRSQLRGEQSHWGTEADEKCCHSKSQSQVARSNPPVFGDNRANGSLQSYLGSGYSKLGSLVGVCLSCTRTCSVMAGQECRARLGTRASVAVRFGKSPSIVSLRHQGPGGHSFLVPSAELVVGEWNGTAACMSGITGGALEVEVSALSDIPEAMSKLVSYLADRDVTISTRLDDTAAAIVKVLDAPHQL